MTHVFGATPTELPPLTIWEALKLAEERSAFATIVPEDEPDVRIHVFGGRLLAMDQDNRSVDLVRTIAELLGARRLCSLGPLCDVPDAADRPTLPIAESLVAAVRLQTASAKLLHDPELAGDKIVATTFGTSDSGQDTEPDEAEQERAAGQTEETEPSHDPTDANADKQAGAVQAAIGTDSVGDGEPADLADERKSEADRMRREFFERRARGRGPGTSPTAALSPPVVTYDRRSTTGESRRRRDPDRAATAHDRQTHRTTAAAAKARRATDRQGADKRSTDADSPDDLANRERPTQRTALRSLIRSLVS